MLIVSPHSTVVEIPRELPTPLVTMGGCSGSATLKSNHSGANINITEERDQTGLDTLPPQSSCSV